MKFFFFLCTCLVAIMVHVTVASAALEEEETVVVSEIQGPEEEKVPQEGSMNDEEEVNLKTGHIQDMFEGDIILTPWQKELIRETDGHQEESEHQIQERAVVRSSFSKWSGAVVPYELHSSLGSFQIAAINRGIQEYRSKTCVRFQPRNGERDYVLFIRGRGCYSSVGRISGGQQVSIGSGCESLGIVLHEMFHALGRWHEQSRPDRDQYIRVNYENIRNGLQDQFEKASSRVATTNGVGYDYFSLMHYSAYAFSRNRQPTIVPLDSSVSLRQLGQRNTFSSKDLQHINALYCGGSPPPAPPTVPTSPQWSSWSAWSRCSVTCGRGNQERRRYCLRGSCIGDSRQLRLCITPQTCPSLIPSQWSSWSAWSQCSASCGQGSQERVRRCLSGSCTERSRQFRVCYIQTCPTQSQWSSWSTWSQCSASCGRGIRKRTRNCLRGSCSGSRIDIGFCNTHTCPTTPPPASSLWSPWSAWSRCSTSCGVGIRQRTRTCLRGSCLGSSSEIIRCNNIGNCPTTPPPTTPTISTTPTTPPTTPTTPTTPSITLTTPTTPPTTMPPTPARSRWSSWSAWSQCSTTCGPGTQQRTRSCEGGGGGCNGAARETRTCNSGECGSSLPGMSSWSEWSRCTRCGGFRWRNRRCLNQNLGCSPPYFEFDTKSCECLPGAAPETRIKREAGVVKRSDLGTRESDSHGTTLISVPALILTSSLLLFNII